MEVKKIHDFEYQQAEYLHQIGELVNQVAHWKEYADDLAHHLKELDDTLQEAGDSNVELGKLYDERVRERNLAQIKVNEMQRTIQSIQSELMESLTPDTYMMLAATFNLDDLELPFEEV